LVVYDRSAKTVKDLLPKFENWVDEFAWAPNSKKIYFTSGVAGESPLFASALDGNVQTINGYGSFSDLHPSPDNATVIASRNTVQMPSEVIIVTEPVTSSGPKTAFKIPGMEGITAVVESETVSSANQLTSLNTELWLQLDESKLESFWFTAADKTKLQGFLIRPPAFDPAKKYPVKFLIHGGPQGAWGDDWSYRWNPELFAANGYVVIMINMRGSTGYGQTIVDGVNGDWGGKPFTDLMEGLDYAEQHYPFIDKNRECALGASYGGYMANWVEGHTSRFKCIVSHDGMFNPESAYGETEELWFNEWEFKGKPWDYYGKPDAENPYRKWSPMLSARNFHTPMLVVHGQLDYRLDVSEGYQMFTTLQRLKVHSKMLYFPDEGHWVLKPQNARLWYKTVNDWVDEWTGKAGNRE
jgi:dipeptidyl aminopeptidase/acylaminoacyl peptidase